MEKQREGKKERDRYIDRKIEIEIDKEIENIGRECVWGVCEYIHKDKKNIFYLTKYTI